MAQQLPWTENWNPTYKITFGTRSYTKHKIPPSIVRPEYATAKVNEVVVPSNALSKGNITDPRGFTFSFESKQMASSKGSDTEDSYLTLHNLNEEEKEILFQPNAVVIVEAGFQGYTTLCYTGDVVDITPVRKLPDIDYVIKLKAEGLALKDTMVSTHYDETMSEQDIIIDMVGRFSGLALGTYGLEESKDRYKTGGKGFTGSLITNFDRVMAKNNLEYAVINGKMVIIPFRWKGNDVNKFANNNYILPPDNIKNITDMSDNKGKSSDDIQSKVKVLQINTPYIPAEIGEFLTVPSTVYDGEFTGSYIIKGRRVILQSKGNAWDCVFEVEEVAV